MGFWRTLGYIFGGLIILSGFIILAFAAITSSITSQASFQPGPYGTTLSQLGALALVYGGITTIVLGILIIWALVKSGQIENIDKNIKIIAEWAKSQEVKSGLSDEDKKFLENEQRKLDEEERYLSDIEHRKKEKEDE
jgi:hypothetical protein